MAMFFRGQKGSPVPLEFDLFLEDIKPWTSAQAQSDGAVIPLLLAWRRGSKHYGSTKRVLPSVDGSDGGKVVFNESFKLPATLFVRKTGGFLKKSVTFALLEDEGSKAVKISRQLATGELDLSQFGKSAEACSTSIPLSIGLRGTHTEGDPTLFLRVSTSERFASSSSKFPARLSSEGRPDIPQETSYFLSESDDSEEEEIDNEESPRSLDDESMNAEAKAAIKREILFSPHAVPPTALIFPNSVSARERPASPPSLSDGQSSGRSFSDAKVGGETRKKKVESLKWSEEEKRQILISLSEPRKSLAAAAKTLDKAAASAAKSVKAARVSFGKSVESPRRSFTDKSLEGVRNSYAGKDNEPVAASAETYRMADAAAASAAKTVEEATAFLGNSVVAAAAVYAAKQISLSKDGRPSNGSIQELPPSRSSTSPPPNSGGNLDLSESRQTNPVAAPISPPPQPVAVSCNEKTDSETKGPDAEDPNDEKKALLREAKTKFAMIERRTLEELRSKAAAAEANEKKGKEIVRGLEEKLLKREDELRDTAAIEAALYSVIAEHTSSSHKVHTPARRLARLYLYAFKNCSPERRASAARNSVLGLVVAVRASGNDVPRMTYWWSNIVVLRESIMQACTVEATGDSGSPTTSGSDNSFADRAKRSQQLRKRIRQGSFSGILGFKIFNNEWKDCNTYVVALLKVETWVYGRILECVWWQAMAPPMQVGGGDTASRPGALGATFMNMRDDLNRFAVKVKDGLGELNKFAGDVTGFFTKERQLDGNLPQLGDARVGTISIEIWKNAFINALKRICPLQGHDAECGCLPVLSRQVIEECVDRLDVAIFNAIMRTPEDKSPTDPLADPITDLSVLPIPAGHLSFGAGSQLKNAVVTWSTWLSALLSVYPNPRESISKGASAEHSEQPVEEVQGQQKFRAARSSFDNVLKAPGELFNRMQLPKDSIDMGMRREAARKEAEKANLYFVLLRAAGDLLMLPKEMLMDKAVRKEVCPQLKLPLIRRILCNFGPDEFAPAPISPALVAAIDTEVSLERQDERGIIVEEKSVAPVPDSSYTPPSSAFVRLWIGEPPGTDEWGITASSLLRKGYGSDDELNHLRTPLAWLSTNSARNASSIESDGTGILAASTQPSTAIAAAADDDECAEYTARFQLLQEVWGPR